METIITAALTGLVSLLVCVINNRYQQDKTRALMEYKIDQLTERVDKHNSLIERTYHLEEQVSLHQEKLKVANHRIDDLEQAAHTEFRSG